jgi:hypothetical protein
MVIFLFSRINLYYQPVTTLSYELKASKIYKDNRGDCLHKHSWFHPLRTHNTRNSSVAVNGGDNPFVHTIQLLDGLAFT